MFTQAFRTCLLRNAPTPLCTLACVTGLYQAFAKLIGEDVMAHEFVTA